MAEMDNNEVLLQDVESAPEQLVVEGAGTDEVNGVYTRTGSYNDCGVYTKKAIWEGESITFSIGRDGKDWNILRDDPHLGTEFYVVRGFCFSKLFIPNSGWKIVDGSPAKDPPPKVSRRDKSWYVPSTAIAKPIASALEVMFSSDDFADFKLICEGGDVIPTHKVILAATVPYFKTVLAGSWQESTRNEIRVHYSPAVVRAVLKMLYTGVVTRDVLEKMPLEFIKFADEYQLPWLKQVAENVFAESPIDESNLMDNWQVAHKYNCNQLKKKCIGHVLKQKENGRKLGEEVTSLMQKDDPELWKEFEQGMTKKRRHE